MRRGRALPPVALVGALLLVASDAWSSDAKAELVVEMERTERTIEETRWHLNNLEEKKALKRRLDVLERMFDAVVAYEGELMAFPCAGSTIDPEGGPPRSTAYSDQVGLLSQASMTRPQGGKGPPAPGESPGGQFGSTFHFIRFITNVEVRLIVERVAIEAILEDVSWNLNSLQEKNALLDRKEEIEALLRRVRNSRC